MLALIAIKKVLLEELFTPITSLEPNKTTFNIDNTINIAYT